MQRFEFRAMGSRMLALVDTDAPAAPFKELQTRFELWEQALSRFRMDSELTRLNARAGSDVTVSQDLWDVFSEAARAHASTGGLVNALIFEQMVRAGYDRSFEAIARPGGLLEATAVWNSARDDEGPVAPISPSEVVVDPESHVLRVPPGRGLDFGGIAKGWAAERGARFLSDFGPSLLSAGGDIALSGPRADDSPWPIGVDNPFHNTDQFETIYVERGGIATSGRDRRHWHVGGRAMHHIIDPRTSQPALTDVVAVTVIAPNTVRAEALAKAVLIQGSDAGKEWLEGQSDAAGIMVLESGKVLYSRQMELYL